MCLAIPYKIEKVAGNQAEVEAGGGRCRVSLEMLPGAAVGDWVLVNLGQAISKISEKDAREILNLYREIAGTELNLSSLKRNGGGMYE